MTTAKVDVALRDGVLVLTLAHPPSNALTPQLRAGLLAALAQRPDQRPAQCRAIVLAGAGGSFSSLLPIAPDPASPSLAEVCQAVAGADVPVVAAIQGLAFGPGAELALAASARVGQHGCRIAFPEVALGLCSAGGSTRRLARRVGAGAAIQLLLSGRVVGAAEALELGLLDMVVDSEPVLAAEGLARRLAEGDEIPAHSETAAVWQAAVTTARLANAKALPAARRIIDCVEAALLLPADAADRYEAVARSDLEASPEAAALCAAALAERRAARLPAAVARADPVPLTTLGLVGEAEGLIALARAALLHGIAVRWLNPPARALAEDPTLQGATGLRQVDDPRDLADVALQVHAQPPPPGPRHRLADGAAFLVLAGPETESEAGPLAEAEMGLALAPSGRACEVAVVAEEAPRAIATALAGLRLLQITPLLVGLRPGIGRATLRAGQVALDHLAATGVPPAHLAAALAPYAVRPRTLAPPILPGPIPPDLSRPDLSRPDLSRPDISRRWLAAMAVEGVRLVEQARARRPSDIDHALVSGHGFARWQGGPMHQADRRGLMVLRHDLRLWAEEHDIWSPPPLLDRLIRDGLTLAALNGN